MHDGKYHSHNHVSKLHYYLSTVISKLLKNRHTEKKRKEKKKKKKPVS